MFKVNIAARAICSDTAMSLETGFCINMQLYLSSSLWGNPLRCDLYRKRIDQKNITELY